MAIDESIFPKDCYMAFMDNGKLSPMGKIFLDGQKMEEWQGRGAEQPCFGCRIDDCTVRVIPYHEVKRKYFVRPKGH